jgi:hypothetical protein
MPQEETIIPEAEVIIAENQEPTISFAPVTEEDNIIIPTVETEISAQEEVQEQVQEQVTEVEEEYEPVELNEDLAIKFLAESKGMTVEEFQDSLTSKEQKKYAPAMEKFNEFIEKTGNTNYNDFLETQKDWSTESEESRLRNYIKLSNPDLTDREANRLYEKQYGMEHLDEDIDEDEILDRRINIKTDLKKADAFFDKRKEEFNAVGGSDEHIPIEYREAKKAIDNQQKQEEEFDATNKAVRDKFISRTESLFTNNFEGFKIQLGDEETGFEDFTIKPDNLNEVKEFQLDSTNLFSKFLDKTTGEIRDIKEYHEAIYMAQNYKTELNKAYQRGRAKELEIQDKVSKNIQPDNIRPVPNIGTSGISFTKEN